MKQRNNSAFCNLHFAFHRLVAMALVLVMLVGMVPAVSAAEGAAEYVASVTVDGVTEQYTDLQSAVDAASTATGENVTLTLLADVETDTKIEINGGNFTMDLAGKRLTTTALILIELFDGEITLDDSASGGALEAMTEGAQAVLNRDTLVIDGGTVKGYYALVNQNHGELTVNDGTIIGEVRLLDNRGTATVNGGDFFSSREVYSDGLANLENASLTVTDGSFRAGGQCFPMAPR